MEVPVEVPVEVPQTCFMQRSLISQIATSNLRQGRGGRRKLHYAIWELARAKNSMAR